MKTSIEWAVIERELRAINNHFHEMSEQPTTSDESALAYIAAAVEVQSTIERLGATLTDGAMAGRTDVGARTPATDGEDRPSSTLKDWINPPANFCAEGDDADPDT